ncbi:hypothetical protein KQI11_07835 [Acetanaerobacterium sp. MSJ-12]|uniref:hypothetical protein n=1 Tax=Acetanaerobacterium sp. MSJ-12 TaxID=2841535 RepID=UPI001C0EBDA8|nr:hypothetical protein [Acetanaerobacterium sp. MSJ-12]MBU5420029.1 hypothetical protein [Acetanaerobacterium sp. MSJ-12]
MGMAQSAGYPLSAVGPLLFGALFDWTGSWVAPLVFYGGVILLLRPHRPPVQQGRLPAGGRR